MKALSYRIQNCRKENSVFGCMFVTLLNEEVKLKLFLSFLQNMEEMEKSHDSFLQGAQQELRKEMSTLQKKILMDTVSEESKVRTDFFNINSSLSQ